MTLPDRMKALSQERYGAPTAVLRVVEIERPAPGLQAMRRHSQVADGSMVLVIGASGGVGTFAIQIATALGAEVTGVCSTRNVDLVRELGAQRVVDYTQQPISELPPNTFDVVLQLAGPATPGQLRRLLKSRGTQLMIGGDAGGRFAGPIGAILGGALLSAFVPQTIKTFTVEPNRGDLEELAQLVVDGAVRVVGARQIAFDDIPQEIEVMQSGRTVGKVVALSH